MKSIVPLVAIVLAGTTVVGAGSATESPTVGDLAWLAGHWRGTIDETVTEEVWLAPDAGDRGMKTSRC